MNVNLEKSPGRGVRWKSKSVRNKCKICTFYFHYVLKNYLKSCILLNAIESNLARKQKQAPTKVEFPKTCFKMFQWENQLHNSRMTFRTSVSKWFNIDGKYFQCFKTCSREVAAKPNNFNMLKNKWLRANVECLHPSCTRSLALS